MVGGTRNKAIEGRYDLREIGARVDKRRRKLKIPVKVAAAAIGVEKWDWSRKIRAVGSQVYITECGVLADLFDAPLGWPFVPEEAYQSQPAQAERQTPK